MLAYPAYNQVRHTGALTYAEQRNRNACRCQARTTSSKLEMYEWHLATPYEQSVSEGLPFEVNALAG